jgi:hypothetical protein
MKNTRSRALAQALQSTGLAMAERPVNGWRLVAGALLALAIATTLVAGAHGESLPLIGLGLVLLSLLPAVVPRALHDDTRARTSLSFWHRPRP